jgi:hypothetical protein
VADEDLPYEEGTGFHSAATACAPTRTAARRACACSAPRACATARPTTSGGALLGRSDDADIQLEDSFASAGTPQLEPHGDT